MNKTYTTIIKNATTHITESYNPVTDITTVSISTLVAKTYNEILARLIKANWQEISLTMKNGDTVTIRPSMIPCCESCIQNVEWFVVLNPTNLFLDADNLVKVAASLCSYESLLQEQKDDIVKLQKFYDSHIKGHTVEELRLGNDIVINEPSDTVLNCKYTPDLAEKYGVSEEHYLNCVTLAENWQSYSDWYKDVHQVRPRF